MTKLLATLWGAGLLLTVADTAEAQPTQPLSLLLSIGSEHTALAGVGHYNVVRKAHRKTRHAARPYHAARSVRGSLSTGRTGTSNTTTGTASTGQNSVNTTAARRHDTAPGPLTNNGQAPTQSGAGTTGTTGTGTTGGTP